MSASGPPIEEMTAGWRLARTSPSLPESFRTVAIPAGAPWWRKMLAFAGPGYLVAVGYMDPGNWATDLAGGSRFGYTLLSVILLSNLMAILLQALALRLGIVTGRDLAQACRDHFSRPVNLDALGALRNRDRRLRPGRSHRLGHRAEPALRHPARSGASASPPSTCCSSCCSSTAASGWLEAFVIALVATIGVCFAIELLLAQPVIGEVVRGLVPTPEIVFDPANALHRHRHPRRHRHAAQPLPALAPSCRRGTSGDSDAGKREAIKYATIDSTVALFFAFFINAAILILAAATFHTTGNQSVADIGDAHQLLTPLLGHHAGERAVRGRAAGVGPELHHHRARWPARS